MTRGSRPRNQAEYLIPFPCPNDQKGISCLDKAWPVFQRLFTPFGPARRQAEPQFRDMLRFDARIYSWARGLERRRTHSRRHNLKHHPHSGRVFAIFSIDHKVTCQRSLDPSKRSLWLLATGRTNWPRHEPSPPFPIISLGPTSRFVGTTKRHYNPCSITAGHRGMNPLERIKDTLFVGVVSTGRYTGQKLPIR